MHLMHRVFCIELQFSQPSVVAVVFATAVGSKENKHSRWDKFLIESMIPLIFYVI